MAISPSSPSASQGKFSLLQEALVILGTAFLLLGYTQVYIYYPVLEFLVILFSLIAAGWLIFGQRAQTPALKWLLVWGLLFAINFFFSSDPRRSVEQILLYATGFFVFMLTYDLVSRGWPVKYFVRAILIAGSFVLALIAISLGSWYAQWLAIDPSKLIPSITYRPGLANIFAPFAYLVGLLALILGFYTTKKLHRTLYWVFTLFAFAILFVTSSRGGWLGLAAGLAFLFFFSLKKYALEWKKILSTVLSNKLLLSGAILAALLVITAGGYVLYRQSLQPTHGGLLSSRRDLWIPAIRAFLKNPVGGTGMFTYGSTFLEVNSVPRGDAYAHAHSIFMNTLGEMGLLGAGLLVFTWINRFKEHSEAPLSTRPAQTTLDPGSRSLFHRFFSPRTFRYANQRTGFIVEFGLHVGYCPGRTSNPTTPSQTQAPLVGGGAGIGLLVGLLGAPAFLFRHRKS